MDGEGLAVGRLGRIGPRREGAPMAAVAVVKALHVAAVFWAYQISQQLPVPVFLFVIKASSAAVYVLLQRPFSSGKRLSRTMWMRVLRYSILVLLTSFLWALGLTLCGALRTTLLWSHSEFAIVSLLTVLTCAQSQGKGRGAVFFFLGVVCLLLFDNDHSAAVEHPEGPHSSIVAHHLYRLFSFLGLPDHKGGILLLLLGVPLSAVQRRVSRQLSVELGGFKRLQALATIVSASLLLPWASIQLFTRVPSLSFSSIEVFGGLGIVGLSQVADFYVCSIAGQRLDVTQLARLSSITSFLAAGAVATLSWCYYPPIAHGPSVGVVISLFLFLLSCLVLTRPSSRSSSSSLIGYSSSGLPLYSSHRSSSLSYSSLLPLLKEGCGRVMDDPNSRRIFYFLLLNLAFTFVEMAYGMWTNSLGLISDGFHMLFDSSALLIGLAAALMSRWKPTRRFSYGYGRVEVLSGFMNGLFLVAIACVVLSEAIERLFEPPHINTEKLLVVSVAGFVVNLVGIITFSRNHTHSHSHSSHGHSHNANMEGVFLHVLADTMGSVGVIVSSVLIQMFGWLVVDPICSIFIAVLILISVLPLLRESAEVLLLATPNHSRLYEMLNKLPLLDGVLSFSDAHFWQLGCSSVAGTIHVQVAPSANDQRIITMVTNFMRENGVSSLTVQVEKDRFLVGNVPLSYIRQNFPSTPPEVYVNYGPQAGEIKAV